MSDVCGYADVEHIFIESLVCLSALSIPIPFQFTSCVVLEVICIF